MKRTHLLAIAFVLIMLMVAIVGANTSTAQDAPIRITLIVHGNTGDKSFFDSAQRGMDRLIDEGYNVEVNTIEFGGNPVTWESGISDAMLDVDNYEILIAGADQMSHYLAMRAHLYPNKFFIFFDDTVPYDDPAVCVEGCTNVYSVKYLQNEGSFLAGVYAAAITTSDLEGINPAPIIGAVGGQDVPVINDFLVGYMQGACMVNPEVQVLVQYAGKWDDPAKGKEISLAMYEQGADIIFQIAGGTGIGVFEAAQEKARYAIGVDSDQGSVIGDTNPEQAQYILTSMMKNVDSSLYRAIDLHIQGELPYGQLEYLGVPYGVGLAYNDIYYDHTPENILDLMDAVQEALEDGEFTVISADPERSDPPVTTAITCAEMPETDFGVSKYLDK